MKHIKTVSEPCLRQSLTYGGCGECQSSCQSACKTSCTVGNQSCASREQQILAGRDGKTNRAAGK